MGKRQRRRTREAGAFQPPPRRQNNNLGTPGPFMICGLCREPVALYSLVSPDGGEQPIRYIHAGEFVDNDERVVAVKHYGHEALPMEGSPLDCNGTCDFCHAPDPRWVFVPRRTIRTPEPNTGKTLDYSSPWSCCDNCLPAVKSKSVKRMLARVEASGFSVLSTMPPEDRPIFRAAIRQLHQEYLKSAPTGPYELKIPPRHKPVGKRGSLQGM